MREHWAQHLIGRPYMGLGRGPEAFDCWGLCLWIWRTRFALEVPDVGIDPVDQAAVAVSFAERGASAGVQSEPVALPFEGAAVYLTSLKRPHHIGIWLDVDGGGVIHAIEPRVLFTPRSDLRRCGFRVLAYYRPKDLPCPPFTS